MPPEHKPRRRVVDRVMSQQRRRRKGAASPTTRAGYYTFSVHTPVPPCSTGCVSPSPAQRGRVVPLPPPLGAVDDGNERDRPKAPGWTGEKEVDRRSQNRLRKTVHRCQNRRFHQRPERMGVGISWCSPTSRCTTPFTERSQRAELPPPNPCGDSSLTNNDGTAIRRPCL